MKERASKLVS